MNLAVNTRDFDPNKANLARSKAAAYRLIHADSLSTGKGGKKRPGIRNRVLDALNKYFSQFNIKKLLEDKKISFSYYPYTTNIKSIFLLELDETDLPILNSQGFRDALAYGNILEFKLTEFDQKTQSLLKEVSRSEVESIHFGFLG